MITEIAYVKNINGTERKERFLQRKTSKYIYNCKVTAFISKKTRFELKIIDKVLSNSKQYNLGTHIAHLV